MCGVGLQGKFPEIRHILPDLGTFFPFSPQCLVKTLLSCSTHTSDAAFCAMVKPDYPTLQAASASFQQLGLLERLHFVRDGCCAAISPGCSAR
jgi:hypothetical protein